MMNSAGIRIRRTKKMVLRTGHPSDLRSFQLLGLKTSVSHAAMVRVQTKKYLWAESRGGRLRELGSMSGLSVMLDMVKVREVEGRKRKSVSSRQARYASIFHFSRLCPRRFSHTILGNLPLPAGRPFPRYHQFPFQPDTWPCSTRDVDIIHLQYLPSYFLTQQAFRKHNK